MTIWTAGIVLICLLSLLDGILTWNVVTRGVAEEINPIMAALIEVGPTAFFVTKFLLTTFGAVILYWTRDRTAAKVAISLCFIVYVAIMWLHLQIFL